MVITHHKSSVFWIFLATGGCEGDVCYCRIEISCENKRLKKLKPLKSFFKTLFIRNTKDEESEVDNDIKKKRLVKGSPQKKNQKNVTNVTLGLTPPPIVTKNTMYFFFWN